MPAFLHRNQSVSLLIGLLSGLLLSAVDTTVAHAAGDTSRMSVASDGTEGNNPSQRAVISADGRYVVFDSIASNLIANDTNGVSDVFVRDRDPDGNGIFDEGNDTTIRVSVAADGSEGNGASLLPSISADGRYVGFRSDATNLQSVVPDTNGTDDVFVYDRDADGNGIFDDSAGSVVLISVNTSGDAANGRSAQSSLSADGRYVAFNSAASDLVAGDTNAVFDVFVHDRDPDGNDVYDEGNGTTRRVSIHDDGVTQGAQNSTFPAISDDGRSIAFYSRSTQLVDAALSNSADVFVHDRDPDGNGVFDEANGLGGSGRTALMSIHSDGLTLGNLGSFNPEISGNGRFVAFVSQSDILVDGDNNARQDILVHDRDPDSNGTYDEGNGTTTRVSVRSDGSQPPNGSNFPSISYDGRFVAFSTRSPLADDDTNSQWDVYVRDRDPDGDGAFDGVGETARVSIHSDGVTEGNANSDRPAINGNGRHIAFQSLASTLVDDDTNAVSDVFVHSLSTYSCSFVVNLGDLNVSILDLAQNQVKDTIASGFIFPVNVATNPDCSRIYVADAQYGIYVFDPVHSYSLVGTIPLGNIPVAMAIDKTGHYGYVARLGTSIVNVYDLTDNSLIDTVDVGFRPVAIALNPVTDRAYTVNQANNSVTVIDTTDPSNSIAVKTIGVGTKPSNIAINPDGTFALVVNSDDDSVSVVDLNTETVSASFTAGNSPRDVVIDPTGTHAYISNLSDDTITKVDVTQLPSQPPVILGNFTFPGDAPISLDLTPDGNILYVANVNSGDVSVISTSTMTLVTTIPVGSAPYDIVITDDRVSIGDQLFAYAGIDQTSECGGSVPFDASGSTGNITEYSWDFGDGDTFVSSSPTASHLYSSTGSYTVTLTVTDSLGNTDTDDLVIMVQDTTEPVVDAGPDVLLEAVSVDGAPYDVLSQVSATDSCSPVNISVVPTPLDYPLGSTQVDVTATDQSGNQKVDSMTVTVVDTTPPVLTVPADITVEATGPGTVVNIGTATATDIFAIGAITNDAPAAYPLGLTIVTWTVTDVNGNSTTGTQRVTVVDTTPPIVTPPPDITVDATDPYPTGTFVNLGTGTANDMVDGALIPVPDTNGPFDVGTYTITWSVTDSSGNTGSATQTVTILNVDPVVTLTRSARIEQDSIITGGAQPDGPSDLPSIDDTGRYVVFASDATDLEPGDANGVRDIFMHDRQSGETKRISYELDKKGRVKDANKLSTQPAISGNGEFVAYVSDANKLVETDTNGSRDVFLYNTTDGTTRMVSLSTSGDQYRGKTIIKKICFPSFPTPRCIFRSVHENASVATPQVDYSGENIVFASDGDGLVGNDSNGKWDIFVRDLSDPSNPRTVRVSVDSDGHEANGNSTNPSISGDGRFVVFQSGASNLVTGDTNSSVDIFLHDRDVSGSGTFDVQGNTSTVRVNINTSTSLQATGGNSKRPQISNDGRYTVFQSGAVDLVSSIPVSGTQIYLYDRIANSVELVSEDVTGTAAANGISERPTVSDDGRYVAFSSEATDLVDSSLDTNGYRDIFVRDRISDVTTRINIDNSGTQAQLGDSDYAVVIGDTAQYGLYVGFSSEALNLSGAARNTRNVLVYGPDVRVDEGDWLCYSGSVKDPNSTSWSGLVSYGNGGTKTINIDPATRDFSFCYFYQDNLPGEAPYTMSMTVTDNHGGTGTASDDIVVRNVAPTVIFSPDQLTIDEGSALSFSPSVWFSDPAFSQDNDYTIEADYGDGSAPEIHTLSYSDEFSFSLNHVYQDNVDPVYAPDGIYTVTVTVIDKDGGSHSDTISVTVNNVVPVVSITPDATVFNEGDTFTGSGSFSDPGSDTWTVEVNYGDGSGWQSPDTRSGNNFTLEHTYRDDDDDDKYTITVRVTDDDQGAGEASLEVTVHNVAPEYVTIDSLDTNINEGDTFNGSGAVWNDPGNDTYTFEINYHDGTGWHPPETQSGKTYTFSHTYYDDDDDDRYGITVRATDDDGGVVEEVALITVKNVAPTVSTLRVAKYDIGGIIVILECCTVAVDYNDVGTLDTHTAKIFWGDGTTSSANMDENGDGSGTATGKHNYPNPLFTESYDLRIEVYDDDGGIAVSNTRTITCNFLDGCSF